MDPRPCVERKTSGSSRSRTASNSQSLAGLSTPRSSELGVGAPRETAGADGSREIALDRGYPMLDRWSEPNKQRVSRLGLNLPVQDLPRIAVAGLEHPARVRSPAQVDAHLHDPVAEDLAMPRVIAPTRQSAGPAPRRRRAGAARCVWTATAIAVPTCRNSPLPPCGCPSSLPIPARALGCGVAVRVLRG